MLKTRLFDLEERVPLSKDSIDSFERAREYDLNARISMRFPLERLISLVAPFCKEGSQILNVGSQSGLLALMFGSLNPKVEILGIEENEFLLKTSEENMMLAAMVKSPAKAIFQSGSFARLPVEDKTADIVLSYLPLFRCADPVKLLKECARVCKPEGLVFIYDIARDAEEGMISFILQYISAGQDEFMGSLKASYTSEEVKELLKKAGLDKWVVTKEQLNLRICSKQI